MLTFQVVEIIFQNTLTFQVFPDPYGHRYIHTHSGNKLSTEKKKNYQNIQISYDEKVEVSYNTIESYMHKSSCTRGLVTVIHPFAHKETLSLTHLPYPIKGMITWSTIWGRRGKVWATITCRIRWRSGHKPWWKWQGSHQIVRRALSTGEASMRCRENQSVFWRLPDWWLLLWRCAKSMLCTQIM